eukprot:4609103-Pyramimonas_sp.AAC.1
MSATFNKATTCDRPPNIFNIRSGYVNYGNEMKTVGVSLHGESLRKETVNKTSVPMIRCGKFQQGTRYRNDDFASASLNCVDRYLSFFFSAAISNTTARIVPAFYVAL